MSQLTKRTVLVILSSGILALTGCGGSDTPEDNSAAACRDFASAHSELLKLDETKGQRFFAREYDGEYETVVAMFDSAGLATTNSDIKGRISSLVEGIPADKTFFTATRSLVESFNTNLAAIGRACEAAGSPVDLVPLKIWDGML